MWKLKEENKNLLYYIYCALGEKSHPNCNKTSDKVAVLRTVIFLTYLTTNIFIISGVIRHWNDNPKIYIQIDGAKIGKPL
jgi:hypothetical protein